MRARYLQWADGRRDAAVWRRLADDFDRLLGQYIRALLALAFAATFAYSIVLGIAGVPYGLLLAFGAGLLEFIPVIGPLSAAVAILVVAGISGYDHLGALIGFLVVYRMFQDYVLNPYLMSGSVSLPPLLTLFALLAGEELAGVPGLFLSVPVLAAARILAMRLARMRPSGETDRDEDEGNLRDVGAPPVTRRPG